ncbi:MAG: hypothetical protein IT422_02500 [Pirellulaceae bacterium]|nr:hypothetical protein [Pirellulaceae bacterium]
MRLFSKTLLLIAGCASSMLANSASAHFPWVVRTEDGKAAYFFGENPADRTYKLPGSIAKAEVMSWSQEGEPQELKLKPVVEEKFVGLLSEQELPADAMFSSQVTFGIYHGSRLDYYTLHQGGRLPTSRSAYEPATATHKEAALKLNAQLVDTDSGVDVFVLWDGKPLADADVQLFCAEGHEEGSAKTDANGKVSFDDKQVEAGLNGIVVGHTVKTQSGTLDGQTYDSGSHYLTVTFSDPEDFALQPSKSQDASSNDLRIADLPFAVTSFGAARIGDAIYVYGGHTGEAHSYSTEGQSNQLLQLDLNAPSSTWRTVAEDERLQGLALVAHGQRLIRVGGFTALNAPGAEHDLHSQATVRAFDTTTGQWRDLPSLPAGRSSHDAAILGDTIYVVGGWNMDGDRETQWHTTAWSLDLSKAEPKWTELPAPGFERRALAVVAHAGKIFAIGGMDHAGPTRKVSIFDPVTKTWSDAPALVGEKNMDGFGASGWSIDGRLIVTTYSGDIQQLAADGRAWEVIGKTKDARFFHRLLPLKENSLVSVGGANMEEGKYLEPEVINMR